MGTPGLQGLEKQWKALSGAATFLVTLVGSFLVAPPVDGTTRITNLVRVLVAILVAVLLVPFAARPTPQAYRRLAVITVALAFIAVVALFAYWYADDTWVVDYYGSRTVVGTQLNEKGERFKSDFERQGHTTRNFDLLEAGAGDASLVWLPQGIALHRFALAAIYIALVLAFSVAAFCAIHVAGLATKLRAP
jgi:hypothetical protein